LFYLNIAFKGKGLPRIWQGLKVRHILREGFYGFCKNQSQRFTGEGVFQACRKKNKVAALTEEAGFLYSSVYKKWLIL